MTNETKIKGTVDPISGMFTIDIYDWLMSLDEQILEDLRDVWGMLAYNEIAHDLKTGYSSDSYNSAIQKLRVAFLTDEKAANEMFQQCIKGLLRDWHKERLEAQRYQNAYWKLWHQLKDMGVWDKEALDDYQHPPWITNEDVEQAIEKYTKNFPKEKSDA